MFLSILMPKFYLVRATDF